MAAQSLSPRPEILITMVWSFRMVGASFIACATACADSIAGMMPSIRLRYSNAFIRFVVRHRNVLCAADVVQVSVLRADTGVIQTGGDGVNRSDLAVFVLAEIALHTVENAQTAG